MTEEMPPLSDLLNDAYRMMQTDVATSFMKRHGVRSAPNLTVVNNEIASLITDRLAPRISGRTVVEIGGGSGLLAFHMASLAKRVFCIEANPVWTQLHISMIFKHKPANASFLFGAADEFVGQIKGDVAIVCTHSNVQGMMRLAAKFAPVAVDVYGELVEENPDAFDEFARRARLES